MSSMDTTLASPKRLQDLLKETEEELQGIQPRIEELEKLTSELRELKLVKQRLITLKMSLSTLLENITKDEDFTSESTSPPRNTSFIKTQDTSFIELSASKTFHPDKAFQSVDKILKQKNSLNYEMFKAVVFNGGKATTEEIKAFLVESGIKQPQTGDDFQDVPLTEISSRANYLVRKGILQPMDRGVFYSTLGWVDPES